MIVNRENFLICLTWSQQSEVLSVVYGPPVHYEIFPSENKTNLLINQQKYFELLLCAIIVIHFEGFQKQCETCPSLQGKNRFIGQTSYKMEYIYTHMYMYVYNLYMYTCLLNHANSLRPNGL